MRCELALTGLLALAATGCGGDDDCGPGDAPPDGIALTIDGAEVRYQDFTSSPNNDCTLGDVVSLTIHATQVDAPERLLVFCLPAPDQLVGEIDLADDTRIVVQDVFAAVDGCTVSIDRTADLGGSARVSGLCGDGADPAGYALSVTGEVPLRRTCGDAVDAVRAAIAGEAAIVAE